MDTPIVDDAAAQRFVGERMIVVSRTQARDFLRDARSPGIVVTDCGFFPRAEGHRRGRATPIDELIVIACVDGRGWCTTDRGTTPVEAGQILLVPPGRVHAYGADDADPWSVWWMHLAGPSLEVFLTAHGVGSAEPGRALSSFFEIVSLLSRTVSALERDTSTATLTLTAGAAWNVLGLLVAERPVARGMREIVDDAAAAIRGDLRADASAARFARGAHVSSSHFASQFRQRYGVSVKAYQSQARMMRARELLERGGMTVTEVARAVGFADPLYFSRQFSRLHDVSPSAYRDGERGAAVVESPPDRPGRRRGDAPDAALRPVTPS